MTPTTSNGTTKRVIKIFSIVLAIALLWSSLYSISFTTQTSSMLVRTPIGLGTPFALGPNQTFEFNVTILYGGLPLVSTERNGLRIVTAEQPSNTWNDWTRYFMRFDFEFNTTYEVVLSIHGPSGFLINNVPVQGENGSLGVGSGEYMTAAGTYEINTQNIQNRQIEGNMATEVWIDEFQRPLFYYGLAGIAVAFSYPLTVFSAWAWRRNKPVTIG